MKQNELKTFYAAILGVAELYDKTPTEDAMEFYWIALRELELDGIKKAIADHLCDPERGKWMPKPADIRFFYVTPPCPICEQIGVVVRDGDKILPWSLPREVNQRLKPEVCPECKGKSRLNTPGLPNVKFD